jgi:hypothetical protein
VTPTSGPGSQRQLARTQKRRVAIPACDREPMQLLAALDRAERHSTSPEPGVLRVEVLEHLNLPRNPHTLAWVRIGLEDLEASGLASHLSRYGVVIWTPADAGRRQLKRHPSAVASLPESPQHQAWREAHDAAGHRLDGFREDLRAGIDQANELLNRMGSPPSSDVWYQLGERLSQACQRLESATYCLCEWPEPHEAAADIDPNPGRRRRRQVYLWEK